MLVYSVASKQSFDMIRILRDKILNHLVRVLPQAQNPPSNTPHHRLTCQQGADWVPIVIVGNKSDLRADQRHVPAEEGKKLAEEFNCSFTEASARLNNNVGKAFEQMVAEIEKSQNPNEPTGANKCCMM